MVVIFPHISDSIYNQLTNLGNDTMCQQHPSLPLLWLHLCDTRASPPPKRDHVTLDYGWRLHSDCGGLYSEWRDALRGSRSPLRSTHPQDKGELCPSYFTNMKTSDSFLPQERMDHSFQFLYLLKKKKSKAVIELIRFLIRRDTLIVQWQNRQNVVSHRDRWWRKSRNLKWELTLFFVLFLGTDRCRSHRWRDAHSAPRAGNNANRHLWVLVLNKSSCTWQQVACKSCCCTRHSSMQRYAAVCVRVVPFQPNPPYKTSQSAN